MYEDMLAEDADESKIRGLIEGSDIARASNTFYRHAWANPRNGVVNFRLGWSGMRPDTLVWIAAGQAQVVGDPVAGKLLGSATFTVHNVAPGFDELFFRVQIQWDSPLPIITDHFVVFPV
jgi:hypothetical protein